MAGPTLAYSIASFAALSALLGGCASTDTVAEIQKIVRPEIGAITTREVGAPLFETIMARTTDGARIAPGSRVRTGPAVIIEPTGPFAAMEGGFCGPADQVAALSGTMRIPMRMACVTEKQLQDQHISHVHAPVTRADPANFQQQLLYEGKVRTELKLSYREFRGDLARPAFTQELSFDLSDGNIVGAKGARIEVFKATNVDIQYRVLQPFNP